MKAKGYTLSKSPLKIINMSEAQKTQVESRTEKAKSLLEKIVDQPWIIAIINLYKHRAEILKLLNEILAIVRSKE